MRKFLRPVRRGHRRGFTLIEMLICIAIIASLAAMSFPAFQSMRARANSVVCSSNLRSIGVAVLASVSDNDGCYPLIDADPNNPFYSADMQAQSLPDFCKSQGMAEKDLQCPADLATLNAYAKYKSSYEWVPLLDDEIKNNPKIYGRRGVRAVDAGRVVIVRDWNPVHPGPAGINSRSLNLYGDGHVTPP